MNVIEKLIFKKSQKKLKQFQKKKSKKFNEKPKNLKNTKK